MSGRGGEVREMLIVEARSGLAWVLSKKTQPSTRNPNTPETLIHP